MTGFKITSLQPPPQGGRRGLLSVRRHGSLHKMSIRGDTPDFIGKLPCRSCCRAVVVEEWHRGLQSHDVAPDHPDGVATATASVGLFNVQSPNDPRAEELPMTMNPMSPP